MTAEVVIMNQTAVAMAADSAVTIQLPNGDKKIYNTANKLFSLSKYQPVGIMIHSSAKLMGVEWEIIIKEYRKKLGQGKFDTLREYCFDFRRFIFESDIFPMSVKDENIQSHIRGVVNLVADQFSKKCEPALKANPAMTETDAKEILRSTLAELYEVVKDRTIEDISLEAFLLRYSSMIDSILAEDVKNVDDDIVTKIKAYIYHAICMIEFDSLFTGVVVAGYGEKEIFPSLISFIITGVGDGFAITRIVRDRATSFSKSSSITPFAQSEMVASFMDGIDPDLYRFVKDQLKLVFDGITNIIPLAKTQLDQIEAQIEKAVDSYKQQYFVSPILNIVDSLPKTDLAEMAEALVDLTAFKRHVTPDADTVGGPTDVAIISKSDGFIWIKRKHYFQPELNRQFFDKYNMEV